MERQPRRRRRPALSCLECRRRKIKCDRNDPCAHCVSSKSQCTFKVYSREPITQQHRQQPGQDDRPGENLSSPAVSPSFSAQHSHTNTHRSITENAHHLSGPLPTATAAISATIPTPGGQNGTPNTLGRSNIRPPEAAQDAEPNIQDLIRRVEKLEETSSSEHIRGLSDTNQEIFSRQLGVQSSQIMLNKTRVLGWSLRMGITQEFNPAYICYCAAIGMVASDPNTELGALHGQIGNLLQKCKNVARAIKAGRPSRGLWSPDLNLTPPSREIADVMVDLYFQSFESTHRILHVPTFRSDYQRYWDSPESVTTGLRLKILLVIGIGLSLSEHGHIDAGFRKTVLQWIYAAQMWLSGPIEKDRLNITGLQIHCLTILARQIFSVGGDLVWMSMGSLLHSAMQMALHRDPKYLPTMSVIQAELRRRLWATILEMVLQSSLDTAMPPRISFDDFDTEAPSNNNDDELDESTTAPNPHPKGTFTSTSMQLLLLDSLSTRLRLLRLLNGLHSELSYPDVLALSAEITDAFRKCSNFLKENEKSGVRAFHRNLFDFLIRRVLIPLHSPFASKAPTNPLFCYSQKVSLDSAMAMISPEPDKGFCRLLSIGGGMFREGIRYASSVVSFELLSQVEARRLEGTLHRNLQCIEFLKKTMNEMISMSEERVRQGETNVKSHMFLCMIKAQVEAIEAGIPCELKIAQSAVDSLELCYELISAQASRVSSPHYNDAGLTPADLDSFSFNMDMDFFWSDAVSS
ncbi:hypothetical protein GGR54DRAFT_638162 [Hypoxylon sp. NC1633]|nr:hypothetical protein GGR54DRAFT_638162 [Hypoxylon sp. NC1633]